MNEMTSEEQVLIVAPIGQDASAMATVLANCRIPAHICSGLGDCASRISTATTALILTEEAIELPQLPTLTAALRDQPTWSELPLIVLTSGGESRRGALGELTQAASGHLTLLERPIRTSTLLHTVQVAIRSRLRQYQVRDLLDSQRQHAKERVEYAQQLESALVQRTHEVTQAQQRLAAAERMSAVGTLASGLAHDINNILLPLAWRTGLVLSDANLTDEHRADLNVVVTLIDHLRQMAKSLSLFARDPEHEDGEGITELTSWLKRVQSLIEMSSATGRGRAGRNIKIHWKIPDDLPSLPIAPHRLTQAVMNLVHNARDAILARAADDDSTDENARSKATGNITIRAALVSDDQELALSVSDDGIGMSDDVKNRCFEPFFTTKSRRTVTDAAALPAASTPSISGSGMGLALVHGIIQKSGGTLTIDSTPGRGTTIAMHFPLTAPTQSSKSKSVMRLT